MSLNVDVVVGCSFGDEGKGNNDRVIICFTSGVRKEYRSGDSRVRCHGHGHCTSGCHSRAQRGVIRQQHGLA